MNVIHGPQYTMVIFKLRLQFCKQTSINSKNDRKNVVSFSNKVFSVGKEIHKSRYYQ